MSGTIARAELDSTTRGAPSLATRSNDRSGMAGGHPAPATHRFGAMYYNTSNADQGDVGSKLPRRDTGVVWKTGSSVEVSWSIEANRTYTATTAPPYTAIAASGASVHSLPSLLRSVVRAVLYRLGRRRRWIFLPVVQGWWGSGRSLLPEERPPL